MGDSEGPPCPEAGFDEEVEGYEAGLGLLRDADFVDPRSLFVFGHSIGGIIAPVLARREGVAGVVVVGTVGSSWLEYELANARRQMELAGAPPAEIETRMELVEHCKGALLAERRAIVEILKERPACAAELRYPASPRYQHRAITDAINRSRPGNAAYLEIQDMDHFLLRAATMRESWGRRRRGEGGDFHEGLAKSVGGWIAERVLGRHDGGAPALAAPGIGYR